MTNEATVGNPCAIDFIIARSPMKVNADSLASVETVVAYHSELNEFVKTMEYQHLTMEWRLRIKQELIDTDYFLRINTEQ